MSHGARSALFAPLEQVGRAEAVTRRLVDAIGLGLLAPDEQLPSEAELAGRFGVSTVTVREALVALRQLGLVETRRGRGGGSFVQPSRATTAQAPWRDRLREMSLSELRDLGDHYAAVSGAAARLAAERSTPDDLDRLALACRDLREARGPAHARAERVFHLELAAAAQSPRLVHEELSLQAERGGLLWLPVLPAGESAGSPAGEPNGESDGRAGHAEDPTHRLIYDSVAAGDGAAAREHAENHVADAVDRLAELHLSLFDP